MKQKAVKDLIAGWFPVNAIIYLFICIEGLIKNDTLCISILPVFFPSNIWI